MPRYSKKRLGSRNYKKYISEPLRACLISIETKELIHMKATENYGTPEELLLIR